MKLLCLFNSVFVLIIGGLPVTCLCLILLPFNTALAEYIVWWFSVTYFKIILWSSGIRINVLSLENLDPKQNYMFACNHQSFFDIPIMYSVLPYHIIPVAKKSLSRIPIFGWLLVLSGAILIDRSDTKKSIDNMNNAINNIKDNRLSVLIFPEGTRSYSSDIANLKTGGMILAIQTGLPIVPVAISGCQQAIGRNATMLTPINRSSAITVHFGSPITAKTDKYTLAKIVHQEMIKLLE